MVTGVQETFSPIWTDPDTGLVYGANAIIANVNQLDSEIYCVIPQNLTPMLDGTAQIPLACVVVDAATKAVLRAAALTSGFIGLFGFYTATVSPDGNWLFYINSSTADSDYTKSVWIQRVNLNTLELVDRCQTVFENGTTLPQFADPQVRNANGRLLASQDGSYVVYTPSEAGRSSTDGVPPRGMVPYVLWDVGGGTTTYGLLGDTISMDNPTTDAGFFTLNSGAVDCWTDTDHLIVHVKQNTGDITGDWDRVYALSASGGTFAIAANRTMSHPGATYILNGISFRPDTQELILNGAGDTTNFIEIIPADLTLTLTPVVRHEDMPDVWLPFGLWQQEDIGTYGFLPGSSYLGFHTIDVDAGTLTSTLWTFWDHDSISEPDGNGAYTMVSRNTANGYWWSRGGFEGPLAVYSLVSDGDGETGPTTTSPDLPVLPTVAAPAFDRANANSPLATQRWLIRTAHVRGLGEILVDNLRLTIKRGIGDNDSEPSVDVRANRDNKGWTKWVRRGLGKSGDTVIIKEFGGFGAARDWQFEVRCLDDVHIELRKLEIVPTPLNA